MPMISGIHRQGREIGLGIGVAIFIALIINLPLWHALLTTDEWSYSTVTVESSDELFYLTRIQESADGYRNIGNPMMKERREQAYPLGHLLENIVSLPITLFDWRIKTLSIVLDGLFPTLLALTAWFAFAPILPQKKWRILALSMLFLGTEIILWKRPISPQQTAILPLLYLWAFLTPDRLSSKKTLLRSILIGLMLYSYPFHWTYCLAVEGTLWMNEIRRRRTLSLQHIKQISYAMIPFVLMGIPWLINHSLLSTNPDYSDTMSRLGLISRRLPVAPTLQLKVLLCLLSLWITTRWTRDRTRTAPVVILLIAGLLVLNQTLVTGKEAEFSSHYINVLMIPFILTIALVAKELTKKSRLLTVIALCCLSGVVIVVTVHSTMNSWMIFRARKDGVVERSHTEHILDLLHTLPSEQVVLTESSFTSTITTYTSHYPFASFDAYMYLASDEELIQRAQIYNLLFTEVPISPRGVFGTRYENQRLYARTLCRIQSLMHPSTEDCNAVTVPCPACSRVISPEPRTKDQILRSLEEAQVTYALLRSIPEQIRDALERIDGNETWTLYRFRFQR